VDLPIVLHNKDRFTSSHIALGCVGLRMEAHVNEAFRLTARGGVDGNDAKCRIFLLALADLASKRNIFLDRE
jgi:hypothetical protein